MDTTVVVEEEEGRRWHLVQTLAGDQTDGYSGAPGFGVKTAIKWFDENEYNWDALVEAFKSKGLGSEEALLNARLAKILDKDHYDNVSRKPILWSERTSSSSNGSNDGAGVQANAN
jgi:DNA polymerase-1